MSIKLSNSPVLYVQAHRNERAYAYQRNNIISHVCLEYRVAVTLFKSPVALVDISVNNSYILYGVSRKFGLYTFDNRAVKQPKEELLKCVDGRHLVTAFAFSSESNQLAIASSSNQNKSKSSKMSLDDSDHAVTIYDIRYAKKILRVYEELGESEMFYMHFMSDGQHLCMVEKAGSFMVYNTKHTNEEQATWFHECVRSNVTAAGMLRDGAFYVISNGTEVTHVVPSKTNYSIPFGCVNETTECPPPLTSRAFFPNPEYCVGLVDGPSSNLPTMAVHSASRKDYISLTPLDANGIRQSTPMHSYEGHKGKISCMAATSNFVITGDQHGKLIVQDIQESNMSKTLIKHHPLTLNRGNLAKLEDEKQYLENGEIDDEVFGGFTDMQSYEATLRNYMTGEHEDDEDDVIEDPELTETKILNVLESVRLRTLAMVKEEETVDPSSKIVHNPREDPTTRKRKNEGKVLDEKKKGKSIVSEENNN